MVPGRILEDDVVGGVLVGAAERGDPLGLGDARGGGGGVVDLEFEGADRAAGAGHRRARVAVVELDPEGGVLIALEGAGLGEEPGVLGADDAEAEELLVEAAQLIEPDRVETDGDFGGVCGGGHWGAGPGPGGRCTRAARPGIDRA